VLKARAKKELGLLTRRVDAQEPDGL